MLSVGGQIHARGSPAGGDYLLGARPRGGRDCAPRTRARHQRHSVRDLVDDEQNWPKVNGDVIEILVGPGSERIGDLSDHALRAGQDDRVAGAKALDQLRRTPSGVFVPDEGQDACAAGPPDLDPLRGYGPPDVASHRRVPLVAHAERAASPVTSRAGRWSRAGRTVKARPRHHHLGAPPGQDGGHSNGQPVQSSQQEPLPGQHAPVAPPIAPSSPAARMQLGVGPAGTDGASGGWGSTGVLEGRMAVVTGAGRGSAGTRHCCSPARAIDSLGRIVAYFGPLGTYFLPAACRWHFDRRTFFSRSTCSRPPMASSLGACANCREGAEVTPTPRCSAPVRGTFGHTSAVTARGAGDATTSSNGSGRCGARHRDSGIRLRSDHPRYKSARHAPRHAQRRHSLWQGRE